MEGTSSFDITKTVPVTYTLTNTGELTHRHKQHTVTHGRIDDSHTHANIRHYILTRHKRDTQPKE